MLLLAIVIGISWMLSLLAAAIYHTLPELFWLMQPLIYFSGFFGALACVMLFKRINEA